MTSTAKRDSMTGDQSVPMTAEEVLVAARKRIEKPENWCQNNYFDGDRCCARGAIILARGGGRDDWSLGFDHLSLAYLRRAMDDGVATFNDTHTHAEVIAAFDRAIEIARGAQ